MSYRSLTTPESRAARTQPFNSRSASLTQFLLGKSRYIRSQSVLGFDLGAQGRSFGGPVLVLLNFFDRFGRRDDPLQVHAMRAAQCAEDKWRVSCDQRQDGLHVVSRIG